MIRICLRRLLCMLMLGLALCAGSGSAQEMSEVIGLGQEIQIDGGILDFIREQDSVVIRNYAVLSVGGSRIRARNMVYNYETKEVYAEGDVTFEEPGGSILVCDRLFFDTVEWRGTAENVRGKAKKPDAKAPTVSFVGEQPLGPGDKPGGGEIHSLTRKQGVREVYVRADQARMIHKEHMEVISGSVSPSGFANPHWSLYSKAINVRRDQKIEAYHVFLKIGKVPVFYFPYIIKDLKYDWPWIRVQYGNSNEHGHYVLTTTGWDFINDGSAPFQIENLFVDFDWRQKRGWGFGLDSVYKLLGGVGRIDATLIPHENIGDTDDAERANNRNDNRTFIDAANRPNGKNWDPDLYRHDDRWIIDWFHRHEMNDRWDIRGEIHAESDRDVGLEYQEWEFKENKDRESSLDLRRWDPHWQFELVATKRLNEWQDQTEYLPEARISVPGFRLGELPLFVKLDARAGYLKRRFDDQKDKYGLLENAETRVKEGDGYSAGRLHFQPTLEAPLHLGPTVLKPWVAPFVTHYSDSYGKSIENGELSADALARRNAGLFDETHVRHGGDSLTNAGVEYGVDWTTTLYRVMGQENNLRHVLQPTLSFVGREHPEVQAEQLYYFDELDAYREEHYFELHVHNRIQQRGKSYDPLTFDISVRYYPDDYEARRSVMGFKADEHDDVFKQRMGIGGGENLEVHNLSEIVLDGTYRPSEELTLGASGNYDWYESCFNSYIFRADWRWEEYLRMYMYHQYERGNYWKRAGDPYSRTTLAARFPLWNQDSRYAAEVALTYDWKDDNAESFGGAVEQRYTLFYDVDTFEIAFSLVHDRQSTYDDPDKGETAFFVNLRPKGWMGIDRPDSASDAASRQLASRYSATEQNLHMNMNDGINPDAIRHYEERDERRRLASEYGTESAVPFTPSEEVVMPEDEPEVVEQDPNLVPGKDDEEFMGDLPTLEDAGEDVDASEWQY